MTLYEYLDLLKITEQKIFSAANALNFSMTDQLRQISAVCDSISQTFSLWTPLLISNNYAESLKQIQMQLTNTVHESAYTNLFDSLQSLTSVMQNISSNILTTSLWTQRNSWEAIADTLRATLESVEPYVLEEQFQELEQSVQPILKPQGKPHLSLSNLLSIISLLFAIFFGIISNIPDKRIDRIIAQNDTIINQNAEIIELEKEDKDLQDTLQNLTDSIHLLTDEVELLREELEDTQDISISECQENPENGQEQNCDAEN